MWRFWDKRKHQDEGEEANKLAPSFDVIMDAPAKECPKCARLPKHVDGTIGEYRARIRERVQSAKDTSETEILAVGDCVKDIVNHTRQYIEESKELLEKNLTAQATSLDNYLGYAKQTVGAQNSTVQQALTLSEDISKAGTAVDKLANQARLLALNAKIESARLGSAGKAFSVITEEMNHLSGEIAKTNHLIADSIKAIKECLPTIMNQTRSQIEKLEAFSSTMRQLKDGVEKSISTTNSTGNTRLDTILELAYSALSHLQYQDPMVQDLQKIDVLMKKLNDEVNGELGIPLTAQDTPVHIKTLGGTLKNSKDDSDPLPDAGEVLLF